MEIRKATGRELRKMKKIYLEAFPKKERKPFRMMKQKAGKGEMELLSILDGTELVGLAITVLYRDLVLLDYFAIDRKYRGKNYGSEALGLLKERYEDRRFLLEIELPEEGALNLEDRIRRKNFYLRNGMQEAGIQALVFQVHMEVLTAGKAVSCGEYCGIYEHIIGPAFLHHVRPL